MDIDKTICLTRNSDYRLSWPIRKHVEAVNALYEEGHEVIYWTARGATTGIDWRDLTEKQLKDWGCLYNELWMNKPDYDVWVDDKAHWIF